MLNKINKVAVGQEYFKRKIYRKIADWFKDWIKKYHVDTVNEMILNDEYIVSEIEEELINSIDRKQIEKYMDEIEYYKSSMTQRDKENLIKVIYFNLPQYRDAFDSNKTWLENQVKQALIAFDSYIFKVKNNL